VEEWKNGTAVYYWFGDSVFGLNEVMLKLITPLLKSPIFITFFTWGVIALELMLALSIFGVKNKKLSFTSVIRYLFWINQLFLGHVGSTYFISFSN